VKNQTPVVFCTAFNQYALDAFQTVGIDYLLKPFSKATVAKALEKYQNLKSQLAPPQADLSSLMQLLQSQLLPSKTSSVIVQQGDKIIPLDTAEVALFYIEDDNVFAYTFAQKKLLLSQKLDVLEKQLSPTFFRANRQFLINRRAVKDAAHYFHRKVLVNLHIPFSEQIIVGKLKVTTFVEWLTQQ
jgi:DNA-binding LytR/AlgR family response regulator